MAEEHKTGRKNTFETVKKYLWLIVPILLVFVSITSFIAGMSLNATKQPMGRIVDTIILSPEQKLQSLDVNGRLTYSDGSPYANQLLELHSTPVQAKTDENGYFSFPGVSLGSHTLFMLDEGGEIISSLSLYVERTPEEQSGSVGTEGEFYRIGAALDTEGLFIQIQIAPDHKMKIEQEVLSLTFDGVVKNQKGEIAGTAIDFTKGIIKEEALVPSGESLIEPESVSQVTQPETTSSTGESTQLSPGETNPPSQAEASEGTISPETPQTTPAVNPTKDSGGNDSGDSSDTRPTKPSVPETTPEETTPSVPETTPEETTPSVPETTPEETTPEETTPEETTPEETTPEPTEEMEHITVSDKENESWTQNTTIDLFANRTGIGPDRKLAPGSKGSYEFQIANGNDYQVYYTITMEKGVNQQYLIPLRYRLQAGGEYVSGDATTWLTAEQLKDSKVDLERGGTCQYLLEWQWPYEGGNDELDTLIGMSKNLEYELVVKIRITQS